MKHFPTLLLTTFALAACGSEEPSAPAGSGGGASGGAGTSLEEVDVDVPSVEQATQEAAAEIDESNADEEFEKLKAEIEGGGN